MCNTEVTSAPTIGRRELPKRLLSLSNKQSNCLEAATYTPVRRGVARKGGWAGGGEGRKYGYRGYRRGGRRNNGFPCTPYTFFRKRDEVGEDLRKQPRKQLRRSQTWFEAPGADRLGGRCDLLFPPPKISTADCAKLTDSQVRIHTTQGSRKGLVGVARTRIIENCRRKGVVCEREKR